MQTRASRRLPVGLVGALAVGLTLIALWALDPPRESRLTIGSDEQAAQAESAATSRVGADLRSYTPGYLPERFHHVSTDVETHADGTVYEVSIYSAAPVGTNMGAAEGVVVVNVMRGQADASEIAALQEHEGSRDKIRGKEAASASRHRGEGLGYEYTFQWVEDEVTTIFVSGRGLPESQIRRIAEELERA